MDLFVTAVRDKYRFPSTSGELTLEQVWELPLLSATTRTTSLESVAQSIHAKIKESSFVSFVSPKSETSAEGQALTNKLEIVKFIIAERQREMAEQDDNIARRAAAAKAREILAERHNGAMAEKTDEELQAIIAASR